LVDKTNGARLPKNFPCNNLLAVNRKGYISREPRKNALEQKIRLDNRKLGLKLPTPFVWGLTSMIPGGVPIDNLLRYNDVVREVSVKPSPKREVIQAMVGPALSHI
jgi:hypothetical protein